MQKYCPPLFEFPAQPIAWNDVHLFYSYNRTYLNYTFPDYICFNHQSCSSWSYTIRISKISEPTTLVSCQIVNKIISPSIYNWDQMVRQLRPFFRQICASTATNVENDCPETTQFRCDKKCLSKHRLVDYQKDCEDNSDETYNQSCALNDKHRIRCTYLKNKVDLDGCMVPVFDVETSRATVCTTDQKLPHFPTLCDRYTEYKEIINGEVETDETNCEEWLCDNQYTRCDGIWNCLNGADEIHCVHRFCNNKNAHPCLLWNSSQPICLPISRAGDGIIDCIGATDERHLCRESTDTDEFHDLMYRCWNNYTDDKQMTSQ